MLESSKILRLGLSENFSFALYVFDTDSSFQK